MERRVLLWLSASLLLLGGALLCASCQGGDEQPHARPLQESTLTPDALSDEEASDVLSALRREGFVTYVRYTYVSPAPWPARTVAWLDFDSQRRRSWIVEATDSATNPFVWTAIWRDDELYPFLPGLVAVDPGDERFTYFSVPLRQGSRVTMGMPFYGDSITFALADERTQTETDEWGVPLSKFRWAASPVDAPDGLSGWPCDDGVGRASYSYEYTTDMEGVPVSEFVLVDCDGEELTFASIVYHEVGFLDPDDLPSDFFEPEAVRDELVADSMSAFMTRFGRPYWLGFESGRYTLSDVGLCGHRCLELHYAPSSMEDIEYAYLTLRVNGRRRECENEQSLESDVAGARLCGGDSVVWDPPDFHVTLVKESWTGGLSRDELIAVARNLRPYDGPTASGKPPILTMEQVRDFVADTLDLVCPDRSTTIREYRDSAVFEYDESAGEWRGEFGPLGEWAVTDPDKPVAWPVAARYLVEEWGGSYPPSFAECWPELESTDAYGTGRRVRPGEALARFKSYRYRERISKDYLDGDEDDSIDDLEGSFAFPDRAEVRWWPTVAGAAPQEPVVIVVVANRSWVGGGNGWQESRGSREAIDFGPADHLDGFDVDLAELEPVKETVNGVPSLRYDLSGGDVEDFGGLITLSRMIPEYADTFEAHLWLAEDEGWPVRLLVSSSDEDDGRAVHFEYSLDITDANDPAITIEPPVP